MNWKRVIGLDNLAEEYKFARHESTGYTSAQKIPDRWVADHMRLLLGRLRHGDRREGWKGCLVGATRGASGESRQALPKGFSEHYTIARRKPRAVSAAAQERQARARQLGRSARHDGRALPRSAATHGPESLGVISTGQLVTEEFYTLGKLVQLGFGTSNYDGNTTLCMASAVSGYKRSFGSDGPPGAYDDLETRRRHPADRRQHRRQSSDPLPVPRSESGQDAHRRRSARHQDRDDGRSHLPVKPRSDLALLNGIAHILIRDNLIDRDYIDKHTTGLRRTREVSRELHAGASRRDHRPERAI